MHLKHLAILNQQFNDIFHRLRYNDLTNDGGGNHMNLKEAFRYQNKLQRLMEEAQEVLARERNMKKVENTALRHKVCSENRYPGAGVGYKFKAEENQVS